jgi:integrase
VPGKLRGCDVVALKVEDVAPNGYAIDRAAIRQRKTRRPVKFELTEQTREAVEGYLRASGKKPGEFLFTSRRDKGLLHDDTPIRAACLRRVTRKNPAGDQARVRDF